MYMVVIVKNAQIVKILLVNLKYQEEVHTFVLTVKNKVSFYYKTFFINQSNISNL